MSETKPPENSTYIPLALHFKPVRVLTNCICSHPEADHTCGHLHNICNHPGCQCWGYATSDDMMRIAMRRNFLKRLRDKEFGSPKGVHDDLG